MKLLIAGTRTYTDYGVITRVVDEFIADAPDSYTIIHGGARGVDHLAAQYVKDRDLEQEVFEADWAKYKKRAGMIRNAQMAKACDYAILFWDGQSPGTENMLKQLQSRQKPYALYVNGEFDHEQSGLFD